ncbi:MAG: hypothetical protein C4326_07630 [Ignavibacteria bacterium]
MKEVSTPFRFTTLKLTCDTGVRHPERSEGESKGDGRTEARIPNLKLQAPTGGTPIASFFRYALSLQTSVDGL